MSRAIAIVDSTASHLQELIGQSRSTYGINLGFTHGHYQVLFKRIIGAALLCRHGYGLGAHHQRWQLEIICRLHGDGHIAYPPIDFFLCPSLGLVRKDYLLIAPVRQKELIAVMTDKPAQPLAHVQQAELSPQVHKSIGTWCPRQPHNSFHHRAYPHKCLEPPGLSGLEGTQLVNNHHIKIKGVVAHQPVHIFSVDDGDLGSLLKGSYPLGGTAHSHGIGQIGQVTPFLYLCRPGIPCYTQGSNNQHFADHKAVMQKFINCSKGDDRLAKAAIQKDGCDWILQNEVGGKILILMR